MIQLSPKRSRIVDASDYAGNDLGAQINSAVTALGSSGGTIIVPPSTYTLATQINLDSNVPVTVLAGGSEIRIPASGVGVFVDGDNGSRAPGCDWHGGTFTNSGGISGQIGVKLRNAMRFRMHGSYLTALADCVLLSNDGSVGTQPYCESNTWFGCTMHGSTYGVRTEIVSGGNASFDQNRFVGCDVPNNTYGYYLVSGADLYRFAILGGAIWLPNSGYGIYLDGKVIGLHVQTGLEATGSTPVAGLYIGPNANNYYEGRFDLSFTGSGLTSSTRVVRDAGATSDAFFWGNGDVRRYMESGSAAGSTNPWSAFYVDGETRARISLARNHGVTGSSGNNRHGWRFSDGTNSDDAAVFYDRVSSIGGLWFTGPVTMRDGQRQTQTSYAATITPDSRQQGTIRVGALTGGITVNATSNTPTSGHRMRFIFRQDATGGRAITWNAVYKVPAGFAASGTASQRGSIEFEYDATSAEWVCSSFVNWY